MSARCADCGAKPCGYPGECFVPASLEDGEVATVIDALAHYRDMLRAQGLTGNAAQSALDKINGLMTPAVYGLRIVPVTVSA